MNANDFKQIKGFVHTVAKQSNTRHLSWMTQFKNRMQTEIVDVIAEDVPPLLTSAITQLNTAVEHEDQTYLLPSYKALSAQIAELDDQRDKKYAAAKQMATALTTLGSADQQQYAQELLDMMDHYKVDTKASYAEETTKMNQLIQELQSSAWQTKLTALALKTTFDDLTSLNTQIQALIDERNDALSQIPEQAMRTARAASDEAYALCVTVINAFAIAQWEVGQSPYDTCIDRVNQDQEYYVNHVFPKEKKLKTIEVADDVAFTYVQGETWNEAIEEHPEENAGWTASVDNEVQYGEQRLLDEDAQPVDADTKVAAGEYSLEGAEPEPQPEPQPDPDVTPVTPE